MLRSRRTKTGGDIGGNPLAQGTDRGVHCLECAVYERDHGPGVQFLFISLLGCIHSHDMYEYQVIID
jgi:hypothetical protein